jgi:hypothetical protein
VKHKSTHKMTVTELKACGCERCQDALHMHSLLDQLIESSEKTSEALLRLEATVARLRRT